MDVLTGIGLGDPAAPAKAGNPIDQITVAPKLDMPIFKNFRRTTSFTYSLGCFPVSRQKSIAVCCDHRH